MIITFGFVFFIILITLSFLSYVKKIHYNVPVLFVVAVIVSLPFLYFANQTSNDKLEGFSNPDFQSTSLFYTNEKKNNIEKTCVGCPAICDTEVKPDSQLLPAEKIDNPISSKIKSKNVIPFSVKLRCGSNNQSPGLNMQVYINNILVTYISPDSCVYFIAFPVEELSTIPSNKYSSIFNNRVKKLTSNNIASELSKLINNTPNDSFIIVATSGNNLNGLIKSPVVDTMKLISEYKLNLIDQLEIGASYAGIVYKRGKNDFIEIYQQISPKTSINGVLIGGIELLKRGVKYEIVTSGKEFFPIKINKSVQPSFVDSSFVYLKHATSSKDFYLVFTSEDNQSFVYLSESNDNPVYSESPEKMKPSSKTILEANRPQKWVIDPVYKSSYSDLYYIKTFDEPVHYLEVIKKENGQAYMTTKLFKGGASQYFKLIKDETSNNYKIKNDLTNLFIGYNDFGGYLYNDNGSILVTDSDKYDWKIIPSTAKKPNSSVSKAKPFDLKDTTSPKDFPTNQNAKSPWNTQYTPIWNGKWVYHGTTKTYTKNRTQGYNNIYFLNINIDNSGEGFVNDPYFGARYVIKNAGSNILTGIVNNGKYKNYMAVFEMLPSDLNKTGKSFPVKMRYYVMNNENQIFNLSGLDPSNLNAYSVKFIGDKPGLNTFLEMSGIVTDTELGFPKATSAKLEDSISYYARSGIANDVRNGNYKDIPNNTFKLKNELPYWKINIDFTNNNPVANRWQSIIGNMYNYSFGNGYGRGWGLWLNPWGYLHWSESGYTWNLDGLGKIIRGVPYSLEIKFENGVYNFKLTGNGKTADMSFNKITPLETNRGFVTMGGHWQNTSVANGEKFDGSINSIRVDTEK